MALSEMSSLTALTTLEFAAEAMTFGTSMLATALCLRAPSRASRLLAGFFVMLGLATLANAVILGWSPWLAPVAIGLLLVVNAAPVYLAGPLLYAHVTALLRSDGKRQAPPSLWHALPAGLVFVYMMARALLPGFSASAFAVGCAPVVAHAWTVMGVAYLAVAAWQLHMEGRNIEEVSADASSLRLGWLRRMVIVVALLWLVIGFERITMAAGLRVWPYATLLLDGTLAMSVFLLACGALRSGVLGPAPVLASAKPPASGRYARSGLDDDGLAQVATGLTRLMQEQRLHVDETLDLRALSERSGWSPNYISQALNQRLGRNFFEFVNGFRIAAAERCLADPHDTRTILEIALACGFGSKSTFNTVFKRMAGATPSAFRRRAATPDPAGPDA